MDITKSVSQSHSSLLGKVSLLIAVYMVVAALGAHEGTNITGTWSLIGLLLLGIGCIIGMRLTVETYLKGAIAFAIGLAYILGLMIASLVAVKIATLGWQPVATAFLGSSAAMLGFGAYGYLSSRDFRSWGMGLSFGLLALIVFGVAISFLGGVAYTHVAYGFLGMLLFSGYFIYDANKLRRTENTWESAVMSSVQLFLDFMNFFEDWLLTK